MTHEMYNGLTWTRNNGDALAPEHENIAALDVIRRDIGSAAFRTKYQQDPASAGSAMLDFTKVSILEEPVKNIRLLKVVQAWDTAIKDGPNCDFSVGMTFGWDDKKWIILDVQRGRMNFSDLKARAKKVHKKWNPDLVIVEDSANGTAMVMDLKKEGMHIKTLGVDGSKEERFAIAAEWLETGKLALLGNSDYFDELRRELVSFPEGRFDDQVDAISLFVRRARLPRPIARRRESGIMVI